MTNRKPTFKEEALSNISEIIRNDILPLLVEADIHQLTIENPIQDVFSTGLNINIVTKIKVEPLTPGELLEKENQSYEINKAKKQYRGIH